MADEEVHALDAWLFGEGEKLADIYAIVSTDTSRRPGGAAAAAETRSVLCVSGRWVGLSRDRGPECRQRGHGRQVGPASAGMGREAAIRAQRQGRRGVRTGASG